MIEKTNPYTPMFITVDEFDNYWSVNLRDMLRTSANESNQAEMFLARVERRLMAYIDNNTFRRYKYEELCGHQLNAFKEAIVLQAMYVYKNGDIGMDSGYDAERGLVAKRAELVELSVCQDAIDVLANAGLWNMSMKNRPRKFGGDILYGLGLTGSGSSGCCPSGGGSGGGGSGGGGGGTPGPVGPQGPRGVSIESVTLQTDPFNPGSGEANVYQVNLDNGDVAGTFSVYNGQKGADGAKGDTGENGSNGRDGADAGFGNPVITVNEDEQEGPHASIIATGPNTAKVFHFAFYNIKGDKGGTGPVPSLQATGGPDIGNVGTPSVTRSGTDQNPTFVFHNLKGETGQPGQTGPEGPTGNGILSITKTDTQNLVDTYTITFTNGSTTTFQVTNGENGRLLPADFSYSHQSSTQISSVYGQAGLRTFTGAIPSGAILIGSPSAYDHDGNSLAVFYWNRTSDTTVSVTVKLETTTTPDDDGYIFVPYIAF